MLWLAVYVLVANVLDAWLTLWWVNLGVATESNPLLKDLVDRPTDFVVAKLLLVSFGVLFLWGHRRQTLAFFGLFAAALTYSYVLAHHLAGALKVFGPQLKFW